jgi:fatty acid desaturase
VSRTSARRLFWWVAFVLALILGVGAALVLAGSESHAASHGSYSTQVTD